MLLFSVIIRLIRNSNVQVVGLESVVRLSLLSIAHASAAAAAEEEEEEEKEEDEEEEEEEE